MKKVLVVCGPTGSGKTGFALELAKRFSGELISADSRQVYKGMDIITGKDLPPDSSSKQSNILWRGRNLPYYSIQGIKVWLYDVVDPDEEFNVSYWRECTESVIEDITGRNKLPIVVGGTGLYIKSLLNDLSDISIPADPVLRNELSGMIPSELFTYLNSVDSSKAAGLNESDRQNPRRLMRAIEVALAHRPRNSSPVLKDIFIIGLALPVLELDERIEQRVLDRISGGAREEFDRVRGAYNSNLPSLTASGYQDWDKWPTLEKQYARRQLTWFKKMPSINWFDMTHDNWKSQVIERAENWYNNEYAQEN